MSALLGIDCSRRVTDGCPSALEPVPRCAGAAEARLLTEALGQLQVTACAERGGRALLCAAAHGPP